MHKLESGHVMSLLFIAVDERNHFVIGMDYMAKGSVEQFIKDKGSTLTGVKLMSPIFCLNIFKLSKKNPENTIYVRDALKWIYQIGMGLNYLLDKGLIHRDISARNNLLDSSLNARLGDMGLTKNTGHEYNNDIYYPVSTQTPLPAYIMAPELLDSMIRHGSPLY